MNHSTIEFLNYTFFMPAEAKQLLLAAFLGLIIGFERALNRKAASLRTFSFICIGSCLFTILSVEAARASQGPHYDITRVAAQIVTGVGFLGGGVIFKTTDRIEGITTGAMIWLASAIGMACGFNQIALALWTFLLYTFVHSAAFIMYGIIQVFHGRGKNAVRSVDNL